MTGGSGAFVRGLRRRLALGGERVLSREGEGRADGGARRPATHGQGPPTARDGVARERPGRWRTDRDESVPNAAGEQPHPDASGPEEPTEAREEPAARGAARALARLGDAVAEVVETDLDTLSEPEVQNHLRAVQREIDRLTAHRTRGAGVLEQRALVEAGPGRESRAVKPTRQFLEEGLRLTPSEAKRTGETGRRVAEAPRTAEAFARGDLRDGHARVITDTLRHLHGDERTRVEAQLVEAAAHETPVQLGRRARRLLGRTDPDEAMAAEQRRHRRRYARVTETPDGMLAINALVAGLDKEVALAAIDAFRTLDTAGERRAPEQATADGLIAALRASLDLGKAPTQHGVRPHLLVLVRLEDLLEGVGCGEGAWTGPIPTRELQRLCQDAEITRILIDARSVPIEVSEGRRTVTAGTWKALVARDRGCRWPGCGAPPAWCDAAHGRIPFREAGRLTLDNGVLLCRRHHRRVDHGGWTVRVRGPDIVFAAPDGRRVEAGEPTG